MTTSDDLISSFQIDEEPDSNVIPFLTAVFPEPDSNVIPCLTPVFPEHVVSTIIFFSLNNIVHDTINPQCHIRWRLRVVKPAMQLPLLTQRQIRSHAQWTNIILFPTQWKDEQRPNGNCLQHCCLRITRGQLLLHLSFQMTRKWLIFGCSLGLGLWSKKHMIHSASYCFITEILQFVGDVICNVKLLGLYNRFSCYIVGMIGCSFVSPAQWSGMMSNHSSQDVIYQ